MFRIHVVNSVKGGCGKSTFSLFLAEYLGRKKRNNVIIDLDTCGSSWYLSNQKFLEKDKSCCFLSDLIKDFKGNIIRDHVFKIRTGEDADHPGPVIRVVMADPENAGVINEEEVDLFESTVLQLIERFQAVTDYEYLEEEGALSGEEPMSDIILDMPPGYEAHSERIVRHLLMDLNSDLYQYYYGKKDSRDQYAGTDKKRRDEIRAEKADDDKRGYKVYLYMLSGLDEAKIQANIRYVETLFHELTYSTDIKVLAPERIFYVLNDVVGHVNSINSVTLTDDVRERFIKKAKYDGAKKSKVYYIPHINFDFSENMVKQLVRSNYVSKNFLELNPGKEADKFAAVFKEILDNNKDEEDGEKTDSKMPEYPKES